MEDYEITAPISGQVIVKNTKAGDTLNSGGDSNTAMAIIYDMSALTFDMYVDELDVLDVEVGQTVEVTADAFEGPDLHRAGDERQPGELFSNGVTQYPVTVQMDEIGDLLPGMNVTARSSSTRRRTRWRSRRRRCMRGNTVYVQDDSVTEGEGRVPAGFRSVEVETGLDQRGLCGDPERPLRRGRRLHRPDHIDRQHHGMMGMGGMPGGGYA